MDEAAAIGFKFSVFDNAFRIDFDLQAHHIAAGGSPHHTGADILFVLIERAHIAGMLVVIHHFVTVLHLSYPLSDF